MYTFQPFEAKNFSSLTTTGYADIVSIDRDSSGLMNIIAKLKQKNSKNRVTTDSTI